MGAHYPISDQHYLSLDMGRSLLCMHSTSCRVSQALGNLGIYPSYFALDLLTTPTHSSQPYLYHERKTRNWIDVFRGAGQGGDGGRSGRGTFARRLFFWANSAHLKFCILTSLWSPLSRSKFDWMAVTSLGKSQGLAGGSNDWADHSVANDFEGACTFVEIALRKDAMSIRDESADAVRVACESAGGRELAVCTFRAEESTKSSLHFGSAQLHVWFGDRQSISIVAPRYASELFGGISRSTSSMLLSASRAALKEVSDHFPQTASLVLCPVLEPSRQLFFGTGAVNTPKGGPGVALLASIDSRASPEWLPRCGLCPAPGCLQTWLSQKVNSGLRSTSPGQTHIKHTAEVACSWKLPVRALLPAVDGSQHPNLLADSAPIRGVTSDSRSVLAHWAGAVPAWQREVASHKPIWQAAVALGSPAVAWALREWGRLLLAADSQLAHLFGSKRSPADTLELHALWSSQSTGGGASTGASVGGSSPDSPLHPEAAADHSKFNAALWTGLSSANVLSITATWPAQSCTSRVDAGGERGGAASTRWSPSVSYASPTTLGVPQETPLWMSCRVGKTSVSDCALAYLAGGLLQDCHRAFSLLARSGTAIDASNSNGITMLDVALAAEAELAPQDRRAYTRAVAEAGRSPSTHSSAPGHAGSHTPTKGTLERLEDALEGGTGSTPAALRVSRVLGSALGGAARTLVAATSGAALLPPAVALQRLVDDIFCPARVGGGFMQGLGGDDKDALQGQPWGVKGAPPMGLTGRLAMAAAALPGLSSVAILWRMAVASMRARWDDAAPLPHMPTLGKGGGSAGLPPLPDHTACLLHQKLQLLQACIVHRAALRAQHGVVRQGLSAAEASGDKPADGSSTGSAEGWDMDSDSDSSHGTGSSAGDESPTAGGGGGEAAAGAPKRSSPAKDDGTQSHAPKETQDQSTLHTVLPGMFLCTSGSAMCAPITLPDAAEYGCEDSLLQQAALLARLGAGADGARVRARLQTAGLRSDMSAFKAANPGCSLADFVRWHSPKDWEGDISSHPAMDTTAGGVFVTVKTGTKRLVTQAADLPASEAAKCTAGNLSARMRGGSTEATQHTQDGGEGSEASSSDAAPSHVWHVAWADAPPLCANQQPPPIDVTGEGEKVLHFLETIPPAELMVQLSALQLQCSSWLLRCAADGMLQLEAPAEVEQPISGGQLQLPDPETIAATVLKQFSSLQSTVDRASALAADAVLNSAVQGVMGGGSANEGAASPVDVAAGDMQRALAAMGDCIPHLADCETQVARLSTLLTALAGGIPAGAAAGLVAFSAAMLEPKTVYPTTITHPKAQHELMWACVNHAAEAGSAARESRRRALAAAAAEEQADSGQDSDDPIVPMPPAIPALPALHALPPAEAAEWVKGRLASLGSRQSPAMWDGCSSCTLQLQDSTSLFTSAALGAMRSALQRDLHMQRQEAGAARWSNSDEPSNSSSTAPQPLKVEVVCTSNEPSTLTGNSALGAPPLPANAVHRLYVEAKQTAGQHAVAQRTQEEIHASDSEHGGPQEHMGSLDGLRVALVQSQWLA